jgi:DNA-binding MarR family transcriptional regulator
VSLSSVTGLADRLVKCGLVGRARDRMDRRVVMISITLRGEELLSRIRKRRQELIADYFKELNDAEIEAAVRLLRTAEQTGRMR